MDGITPDDVRKKYIETYGEQLKIKIESAIESLNDALLERCEQICRDGYIYFITSDHINYENNREYDDILKYLKEIYTAWEIRKDGLHIRFSSRKKISDELSLNIGQIKKKNKSVAPNEVIEHRAEILDLED